MNKSIVKIDIIPQINKRLKVAAYARVSTGKEAMLNSLASQINHYKRRIQKESKWEFAGIYADEGITGTTSKRDQFQLMLEHCKEGKIDMIITKSISRFARNTLTLLEIVRELKELNVDVFFEEQNIHTLSGEGEMILTFLATFAQEESRSVSENLKWRIKREFKKGLIWGGNPSLGYKLKNKKLHVVQEEAEIVKLIYDLYLKGNSDNDICEILEAKEIKPYKSNKWRRSSIYEILTNYNYTGNLLLQKTYREDHLDKVKKINRGEYDKYLVPNSHEPIISIYIFNRVQRLRKEKDIPAKTKIKENTIFKGLIKCSLCGKNYTFRKSKYNDVWLCSTFKRKGKNVCPSKQVPYDVIKKAISQDLHLQTFDEDIVIKEVNKITVYPDNRFEIELKNEEIKEHIWDYDSRSNSWTEEMKDNARNRQLNRNVRG